MQCTGAEKSGVFKWTITRRGQVIVGVMLSNNRDIEGIHFRVSQQEDQDFLWKALYHAVSVPPGSPPPNREVVNLPMLAQYVDSWMKHPGDIGIVAIEDKTQIGAAWIRKWIGSDQGYGFVDTAIPELSISLLPEYRGIGIGTKLLGLLLEKVSQQYEAVIKTLLL